MKDKKSDLGFKFLVVLIITIAGAIIYIMWLKDFRIFGENLEDYTICKNSNVENAKLKLKITNQVLTERQGNKCKTDYINVPKGKELEVTAKKMANCWDMYLEGKEELFDTVTNNYCAICSVLTFDQKTQVNGLTNYLIEQRALGKSKSYHEYLTNTFVTNDIHQEIKNSNLDSLYKIDTTKPLAVIFTSAKTVNPGSLTGYSSIASGTVGSAIGIIGGFVVLGGTAICSVTTFGICPAGILIIGSITGGKIGYMMGSSFNPNLDTKILLWTYTREDLSQLKCTMLEGKDRLDIKKF